MRRFNVQTGMVRKLTLGAALVAAAFGAGMAQAAVTEVEGSAGGGLVPWALLHPEGPLVSYTNVAVNDYSIQGLAIGGTVFGRVEVSFAHQMVNAPKVGTTLNLDSRINQDVFGVKVKVLDMGKNDAIPQVAIGIQAKSASGDILDALKAAGAIDSTSGTDAYVAATKFVTLGGKTKTPDAVL